MRRTAAAMIAPAVLGCCVVLAGCAGGGSSDAADDTVATEQTPLTAYLSAVWGSDVSPQEQEKRFAKEQAKQEELIAACMKDEGFEYTPEVASASSVAPIASELKPEDRDWVAQWGYGAVHSPAQNDTSQSAEERVDPNADYVASLSESEQAAFSEALSGPTRTDDEDEPKDGSAEYDPETSGCQGRAQHEIAGADPTQSDEFAPLFDKINALYQEDRGSWPGIADLDAEWATCMDTAGYPGFTHQLDAQSSIYQKLDDAVASGPDGPETEMDDATADKIATEEVDLALADLDCREQVSYRDRYQKAQSTREDRFIADNKADLDALKAAAEQAGS